ncbi:hypothetical protein [Labrys wisconsinensis]|uniref:Uncharacterized protein n=1 Tax=Labrys wisconsinensis TaxID=425677 RepID=A0ABU0JAQ5_9HYPH|nr:hypothetical protein [Labrys wisconsinensis]MDQ0470267.1 hypothetical protein [Labrys wisconsinensis]
MITKAAIGPLTQGTIFSCALAEDYVDCVVHGLIITARCDVTNDKVDVYNYIPIVKFDDWLVREGVRALAGRTSRSAMGEMRNTLTQLGLAASILTTTPHNEVFRIIFDADDASSKISSKREQFVKHARRYEAAGKCMQPVPPIAAANALLTLEKAEAGKLVKELCSNAIAEAYYLPGVGPQEERAGYVALLREIRHIPRGLAKAVANGLDRPSYAALQATDSRCGDRLYIPDDDFAWPTGLLQSPFIEHLMQRLTLLFSRIGVSDVNEATVKRLQNRIPAPSGDE